jgi:hypothetical protein
MREASRGCLGSQKNELRGKAKVQKQTVKAEKEK